jgi:hypothetical protein
MRDDSAVTTAAFCDSGLLFVVDLRIPEADLQN